MQLSYPAPFNASNTPHRTTPPDPYLQYPYDCCGPGAKWENPCRNYRRLLGTPDGLPTAAWPAGSVQSWTIAGSGNHYGDSCRIGFSTDGGDTFRVARSYDGDCPHRREGNGPPGQGFEFTVPSDVDGEGNVNCAAVEITRTEEGNGYGGASSTTQSPPQQTYDTANGCACTCSDPADIEACSRTYPATADKRSSHGTSHHDAKRAPAVPVAYNDRPEMFIADDGDGCLTPRETAELKYPDPRPDVAVGDGDYPLELPEGERGKAPGRRYRA